MEASSPASKGLRWSRKHVVSQSRKATPSTGMRLRNWMMRRWLMETEEHTSELQSLMRISYAVFCLKKKKNTEHNATKENHNNLKKTQKAQAAINIHD